MPQPEPLPISPNPGNVAVIRDGMVATMQPGGTGVATARGAPYTMAGKTGTAQVVSRRGTAAVNPKSLPMHLRHRALFVGFAPAENPTIALAIAVEGGGYGGVTAGPIARKIFDAYLLGEPGPGTGDQGPGNSNGTGSRNPGTGAGGGEDADAASSPVPGPRSPVPAVQQ